MVDIVGKVLTPLLLAGLAAIIIKGIVTPLGTIAPEAKIDSAVVTGVKAGYQTMDALAALPFGILVLQSVVDKGYTESGKKFRIMSGRPSSRACCCWQSIWALPISAPPFPRSIPARSAAHSSSWPSLRPSWARPA